MIILAKTHIGLVRKINQDSVCTKSNFCAVADGMGGHKAGDVASKIALNIIDQHVNSSFKPSNKSIELLFNDINSSIINLQNAYEIYKNMGTTLTAIWFCKNKYWIGHIGDSRCYKISDNNIELLTNDHSFVGELLKNGLITKEEARKHPLRNYINRALGIDNNLKIDIISNKLSKKDVFLLCSDGLSSLVSEETMLNVIANNSIEKAIDMLIDEANNNGGNDNISVIIAKPGEDY